MKNYKTPEITLFRFNISITVCESGTNNNLFTPGTPNIAGEQNLNLSNTFNTSFDELW